MKLRSITLAILLAAGSFSGGAWAHPGNTDAQGCHVCRTNCDKWGVPWGQRHCHNGFHEHEHDGLLAHAHDVLVDQPANVQRDYRQNEDGAADGRTVKP